MTRVWLSHWEWACCGDPFAVGDEVDFGIATRDPAGLTEQLGQERAATVQACESHHEHHYADRVRGRVVAVHEATHEVLERKFQYSFDRAARSRFSAQRGVDGDSRDGLPPRGRLTRESVRIEPVPGTTELLPVRGVRLAASEQGEPGAVVSAEREEIPDERRRRVLSGWLVDVDETHPSSDPPSRERSAQNQPIQSPRK